MVDIQLQKQLKAKFNPDNSILRQHQLRMLKILEYIDDICKKNDIKYWLSSGTAIGAVRHQGFVPWDDDADIEMLRKDYKKFVKVMKNEKSENFIFQTYNTDHNYFAPYGKVRDLKSIIKEENSNDLYYKYKGIYVDVFIIESSSSYFLQKLSSKMQNTIFYNMNKYIQNQILRKCYFSVMYIIIHKIIFQIMKYISAIGAKDQLHHTMGSGFYGPRYRSDLFPLKVVLFEGDYFPIPNNYDDYLSKLYGNYLNLPDLDHLEYHTTDIVLWE